MPLEIEPIDDGEMLKVSLTEDGITQFCLVSSYHLVAEKEPQLRTAIRKAALEALNAGDLGTAA